MTNHDAKLANDSRDGDREILPRRVGLLNSAAWFVAPTHAEGEGKEPTYLVWGTGVHMSSREKSRPARRAPMLKGMRLRLAILTAAAAMLRFLWGWAGHWFMERCWPEQHRGDEIPDPAPAPSGSIDFQI